MSTDPTPNNLLGKQRSKAVVALRGKHERRTDSMAGIHLTEKYQVLPSMPPEQFEVLKADIAERGVLVPIDVDEDGHILDGHHRYGGRPFSWFAPNVDPCASRFFTTAN
jgi:hypothetical protein